MVRGVTPMVKRCVLRSVYLRSAVSLLLSAAGLVLLAVSLRTERWPAWLFLSQTHEMAVWSTGEPRQFRAVVTSPGEITVYDFTTTADYDGVMSQMADRRWVEVPNNRRMFFETGLFGPAVKLPSNTSMTIRCGPICKLLLVVAAALSPELCIAVYRQACRFVASLYIPRRYNVASLLIATVIVAAIFGVFAATE